MKIVVDDKIPYVKGLVEQLVDEVVYLPGSQITPADVQDADVLFVRTRTKCNRELLEGSRVKLVVTATIGYDHLDVFYLQDAGIEWSNCPGCNATSVGQYVRNSLWLLERERGLSLKDSTLGIVGLGRVGSAVLEACRPLVGRILLNDPPREAAEQAKRCVSTKEDASQSASNVGTLLAKDSSITFSPIEQLMEECDIITFHTPLTFPGEHCLYPLWEEHPTFHLVDEAFLHSLPRRPVLINSSRGEVFDNEALLHALEDGHVSDAVIDTWEGEPRLNRALLNKVYIGTPHIAGYSADGKANASRISLGIISEWLARNGKPEAGKLANGLLREIQPPSVSFAPDTKLDVVGQALQLYDPREDSRRLKEDPSAFEFLRGNYPLRREQFD